MGRICDLAVMVWLHVLHEGDSVYILPAVAGGAELKTEDLQRYSRQIMLEEIGFVGMEKIRKS